MDIATVTTALREDAPSLVFVNVLLQQLGLPVPAVPTMLLAGSFAVAPVSLWLTLAAAVVASVLADLVWYAAGRAFGYRVLAGLCRLSINPASCVTHTEARFVRWGMSSLLVAKFIPGFSTVAPPIAGALRMSLPRFLLAAAAGAGLWAGLALTAGWMLRGAVPEAIELLDRHSGKVLMAAVAGVGLWLGWKLWQRQRFRAAREVPPISAEELLAELATDDPPLFLDLRGAAMIAAAGPIPGAVAAEYDRLAAAVGDVPKTRPIVTMCACPEDAGAIQAARRLLDAGHLSVRVLDGGYEAWLAATR